MSSPYFILRRFYTNITKQTLRQTKSRHISAHVMARFAPSIFTVFYCNVWQADRFDNLTVEGFNLYWCKSNLRKPAEKKIIQYQQLKFCDRSCATLPFLCYPPSIQIVFATLRYFVAVAKCSQDQFIGPIFQTGYT